ncbi:hypothetical protein Tco_0990869 [Tanacetum coccineum]|uniref:Uncharacterized protein n=1 Tax=Tanacetum coccineum TaxID=301880 RepID=A0ABQ5EYU2_9ASTR
MACSIPHTIDEIQALVQKLIDEDIVRQKMVMELAVQFNNACTAKDDLRKAYEKCNDILQESQMRRLRTEQEKEYQLVNNLLGEITRYMLQKLDHAEEETRVRSLPFDEPLRSFSLKTLHMSSESDTRISNISEAAREEVLASIHEREELIKNYRAI